MARRTSCSVIRQQALPKPSGTMRASSLKWAVPLGGPVVPEVYRRTDTSIRSRRTGLHSGFPPSTSSWYSRYPFCLAATCCSGVPPTTMTCFRVFSSALAFSSSSSMAAATKTAFTSALLKTWAISAREKRADVGRMIPPIFKTAKLVTMAGGMLGIRRATRSASSMPRASRLEPSRFTIPSRAL